MDQDTKQRIRSALLQVGINSVSVGVADGVHTQLPETMAPEAREAIGRVLGEGFCDYLCSEVLVAPETQSEAKIPTAQVKGKPWKTPQKAKPKKRRRHQRLSKDDRAKAKAAILEFLQQHPWSKRKVICHAVPIATPAHYKRLMDELRVEGFVLSRGERRNMVYGVSIASAPNS